MKGSSQPAGELNSAADTIISQSPTVSSSELYIPVSCFYSEHWIKTERGETINQPAQEIVPIPHFPLDVGAMQVKQPEPAHPPPHLFTLTFLSSSALTSFHLCCLWTETPLCLWRRTMPAVLLWRAQKHTLAHFAPVVCWRFQPCIWLQRHWVRLGGLLTVTMSSVEHAAEVFLRRNPESFPALDTLVFKVNC